MNVDLTAVSPAIGAQASTHAVTGPVRRADAAAGAAALQEPADTAELSDAARELATPPDVVTERKLLFRAEDGRIHITIQDPVTGDVRLELPMRVESRYPYNAETHVDLAA